MELATFNAVHIGDGEMLRGRYAPNAYSADYERFQLTSRTLAASRHDAYKRGRWGLVAAPLIDGGKA